MLPLGFRVGGIKSNICKNNDKIDLSLFISDVSASTAIVFTKNIVKAAPILVNINKLKNNKNFFGVIANSGCANACTGVKGIEDAEKICFTVEKLFNLPENSILCASTGIIGQYLNIKDDSFWQSVSNLKTSIGTSLQNENTAILGIMTTDKVIKKSERIIKLPNNKNITIWGCVKGAGMIHPNMTNTLHATMLSFILTDAKLESSVLQKILEDSINQSFNNISVDGDTSTNDTVIALANGQSNSNELSGTLLHKFVTSFNEVTLDLAKSIVNDGEGATKFIEIEVKNAKTHKEAKLVASTVATSPLFKTAMFGSNANWGRIIAAAGRAGVYFDINKVEISIGNIKMFKNGNIVNFSDKLIKDFLLEKEIKILIDIKEGNKSTKYYTCDFSYEYININGKYT
ncbi:MAG: bifunctional glutamate N-acetyltransferase/amino-acid acetyltransferase ArgJ [Endomicrobium sp.]|jgi:glutamate N-acetyltransferase/amino-acid N-acetyltransferase|nr:bifunctional glutamate N-acetyltransferase/amino-acid acetyltransferase ArgJ [Endomicrobium sp.]